MRGERMATTVRDLADLVQGTLEGDGDQVIGAARSIEHAGPGDITFLENDPQGKHLASCRASAVVVNEALDCGGRTVIRSKDPLTAFISIVQHIRGQLAPPAPGI